MKQILRHYPLTLFCVALTWYLCLFKPPHTKLDNIVGFDKVVHVTMYLGTCSVLWMEYLRRHARLNWRVLVPWVVVAPILMSGVIELAQEYCTTTRSGDWADFAANSTGVLLALVLAVTVLRRFVRPRESVLAKETIRTKETKDADEALQSPSEKLEKP